MKIFCPCDKGFTVKHDSVIDLDKNPEILKKIEDGSFLTFDCPKCGRPVRTELQTRIEWPSKNQIFLFVPEAKRIACLDACANQNKKKYEGSITIKKDETPLIGFGELVERLAVIRDELEAEAIEVMKFFILDSGKEIKGKKIKIFYHAKNAEKFELFVHGLKDDELAVMNVPSSLYESILKDSKKRKKQEVFKAVYLGNYLSYQNIFTEGQDK